MKQITNNINTIPYLLFPCALTGPSDYVPISAVDRDVVLTFNNATRRACFNVEIVEDSIFEGDEQFTVQLTIDAVDFDGTPQSISLSPATATVTIVETDPPLSVGFEEDSLDRRVLQNAGTTSLCVVVVGNREITTNFSVSIVFSGGTAGEWALCIFILHICVACCGWVWGTKVLTDGRWCGAIRSALLLQLLWDSCLNRCHSDTC